MDRHREVLGDRRLKARAAESDVRRDFVNRVCKLDEESAIVFGRRILAVRLLPHLHFRDRKAARKQRRDLGSSVLRRVIQHAGRHEHRPAMC